MIQIWHGVFGLIVCTLDHTTLRLPVCVISYCFNKPPWNSMVYNKHLLFLLTDHQVNRGLAGWLCSGSEDLRSRSGLGSGLLHMCFLRGLCWRGASIQGMLSSGRSAERCSQAQMAQTYWRPIRITSTNIPLAKASWVHAQHQEFRKYILPTMGGRRLWMFPA